MAGVACLLLGCQRREIRKIERLAILPLENLTSDPALDWMGEAIVRVLSTQLSASVRIHPYRVEGLRAARVSKASWLLQGYYTHSSDPVRFRAVVHELSSGKNIKVLVLEANRPDAVRSVAENFATSIDKRTRPFGSRNPEAIRAWGEALASENPQQRRELLERSIQTDPNFGEAYFELMQLHISQGNQAAALDVARRAEDRKPLFTDFDLARLELLDATLRNDGSARRRSLRALSRLVSTDFQTTHRLAQLELRDRNFTSAIELFRNALALDPENAALWNELGYAHAYHGNVDGAREALERYRELDPDGFNPLDSLGEVHFFTGRFAEAEKYFLQAQRTGGGAVALTESLKAAQARFMQGNLAGADALYEQFDKGLRSTKNPLAELRRAQWLYITGREEQANALADSATRSPVTEAAVYAQCQLALWALGRDDRSRAAGLSAKALSATRNPALARVATILRSASDSSAQPLAAVAEPTEAYAAMSVKDYARAAELFGSLYRKSSPDNDGDVRTMYAWALSGIGKHDEARALVRTLFLPLGSADEAIFATHAFPHLLKLRAELLALGR
jgi:tetratricopeptide (TPR) repeat protein